MFYNILEKEGASIFDTPSYEQVSRFAALSAVGGGADASLRPVGGSLDAPMGPIGPIGLMGPMGLMGLIGIMGWRPGR